MAKTKEEMLRDMSDERLKQAIESHAPGGVIMELPPGPFITSICNSGDPMWVSKEECAAELSRRSAPQVEVGQRWKQNKSDAIHAVVKIENGHVLSGFWRWTIPEFIASHTLVQAISEPPAPREPKAGEWWKNNTLDALYYITQVSDAGIKFAIAAGQSYFSDDWKNERTFTHYCTFYAESFDAAVEKRAREMGLEVETEDRERYDAVFRLCREHGMGRGLDDDHADSSHHVLAFIRFLASRADDVSKIVAEIESNGFSKSGNAVEDIHFILGAIRELVAARNGMDTTCYVAATLRAGNEMNRADKAEHERDAALSTLKAARNSLAVDFTSCGWNTLKSAVIAANAILGDFSMPSSERSPLVDELERLSSEADALRRRLAEAETELRGVKYVAKHNAADALELEKVKARLAGTETERNSLKSLHESILSACHSAGMSRMSRDVVEFVKWLHGEVSGLEARRASADGKSEGLPPWIEVVTVPGETGGVHVWIKNDAPIRGGLDWGKGGVFKVPDASPSPLLTKPPKPAIEPVRREP